MSSEAALELKYHQITGLYDLAEELVESVESEYVESPEAQLALVEPLVEAVGDSADRLCEEFIAAVKGGGQATAARRNRVETALRRIYAALDSYHERVRHTGRRSGTMLLNIADPVVEKIKRQVESVIAAFIDFLDISLDRIMQKAQIEELKQRQEKIALMLHRAGLGIEQI